MRDDVGASLFVAVIVTLGCGASCVMGYSLGRDYERHKFRREAIERGYAEHDAKTGEWKWKE